MGKPGLLVAVVALLGLIAVSATYAVMKMRGPGVLNIPSANNDQVFKYCTGVFVPDEKKLAALRRSALYPRAAALQPGEYQTQDGGKVYVMGGGFFQILLPSQLQVVRSFGRDAQGSASTDRPRTIIGCTPEHLAKALDVYGLKLQDPPRTPGSQPSTGQR